MAFGRSYYMSRRLLVLYLGVQARSELLEGVRKHVVVADLRGPIATIVLLVVPLQTEGDPSVSRLVGRDTRPRLAYHAHEVVQLRRCLQTKVQHVAAHDQGAFTRELRQVL